MKLKFLFFLCAGALLAASLPAAGIQDWIKKSGYQKTRKVTSRHTSVAAVRGVEEPGDVDPDARDFEGLQKMEQRTIPGEKLAQFIEEGKLKKK